MPEKITVAIDGPAGSGKSTVAKMVAQKLGYLYVDTGAMYRAIALAVKRRGVDPKDPLAVAEVARKADLKLQPASDGMNVFLDGQRLGNEIRTPEISLITSRYIANSDGVRDVLVQRQRELGKSGGVVMEGRDIATEVFPNAGLKVYLNASVKERTRRRILDFKQQGIAYDEAKVEADIQKRDEEDCGRKRGALRKADDAVEVIADQKTPEEIVKEILSHFPGKAVT
jgi:cytidylate kinase